MTNLEKNINTLYLGSGVDIANIPTAVESEVINSLVVTAPQPASTPNWLSVTEDIFNVVGPASGFLGLTGPEGTGAAVALQTAIGLGTTLVSTSAMETNDGSGAPLMQQEEAVLSTVGQLAATATNQFNENFLSLGNTFDRILNDWGRLQAVAGPLTDSTLTWKDQTTGYLLQAYSVAVRREFYAAVLSQTHRIVHFEYAKPDPDPNGATNGSCNFGDFMDYAQTPRESRAWLPGAMIDGPYVQATQRHYFYQNDKWWDLWLFEPDSAPTDCSNTGKIDSKQFFQQTGLFTPIDTDTSTPGLGLYKPTFYKRSGLPVVDSNTNNPYWGCDCAIWPSNGDPDFR